MIDSTRIFHTLKSQNVLVSIISIANIYDTTNGLKVQKSDLHTHSHFSTAVSCLIHLLLSMGEIHFAPVLLLSEVLSVTCDDGWRCENTIAFWLAIRESSYFMCNIVHTTLHFSKNVKSSAMINVKSKGLHCLPHRIFDLAFDTETAYLIFQKIALFCRF